MSDADFDDAVAQAAKLLRASKAPVIAGLGADVAGIVAAFRLAEKLGATIDHSGAEGVLRDQAVLQDIGLMLVSPAEAFQRADVLLVIGDRPLEAWPELPGRLFPDRDSRGHERRVVAVASRPPETGVGGLAASLQAEATELPKILAALRARANGRPLAQHFGRAAEIDAAADILKDAKFGVALWSPEETDTLAIEMLTGLVKDLNTTTRWSGLSVSSDASAIAAAMASGWMTGLPLRVSFARGRPLHDPWQYDARRLVESGEADAVVWISALDEPLPDWLGGVTTIVLGGTSVAKAKGKAAVSIALGRPGRDHDGVAYDRTTGTLVEVLAQTPTKLRSAADVLNRIAALAGPP